MYIHKCLVFIFWGGYSYTEKKASRVAVVNGSYIGIREYQFGNHRYMVITAFSLTPEQPVAPDVYEVNQTFLIIQLKAREPGSEEEFQKQKTKIARNLLQIKKEQVFSRWVTARRQQSDVRVVQEL